MSFKFCINRTIRPDKGAIIIILFLFAGVTLSQGSLLDLEEDIMKEAEKIVKVTIDPPYDFRFGIMEPGVLQHIDRKYTYDVVPEELSDGLLFQGIHRPPVGTVVSIELLRPATIYFFFHYKVDGGYSEIFKNMTGWVQCSTAPQYDIHNGEHGLKMIMYKLKAGAGTSIIPPTVSDRACFSFVIQADENPEVNK